MSDHEPLGMPPSHETTPAGLNDSLRRAIDDSFSAFYKATVRNLVGFLIMQGATLTVASDIAQETLTKAYQRWSTLTYPKGWVYTTASRALVRHAVHACEEPHEDVPEPTSPLARPDVARDWETRQVSSPGFYGEWVSWFSGAPVVR
ncbi:RNA polymerase sigma factor [Nonomuraea maritima]|uniref:RNA polymerase sigma factor n=1 Tax=Nonomuraea maritima TaxID=683260 RepID=UPI003716881E